MKKVLFLVTLLLLVFVFDVSAFHPVHTSHVRVSPVSMVSRTSSARSNFHRNVAMVTAIQIAQRHRMHRYPLKTGLVDSVFMKNGKSYVKIDSVFEVRTLKDVRTDSLIVAGDSVSIFKKSGANYVISEMAVVAVVDKEHHPMPNWIIVVIGAALILVFSLCFIVFNNN